MIILLHRTYQEGHRGQVTWCCSCYTCWHFISSTSFHVSVGLSSNVRGTNENTSTGRCSLSRWPKPKGQTVTTEGPDNQPSIPAEISAVVWTCCRWTGPAAIWLPLCLTLSSVALPSFEAPTHTRLFYNRPSCWINPCRSDNPWTRVTLRYDWQNRDQAPGQEETGFKGCRHQNSLGASVLRTLMWFRCNRKSNNLHR